MKRDSPKARVHSGTFRMCSMEVSKGKTPRVDGGNVKLSCICKMIIKGTTINLVAGGKITEYVIFKREIHV